MRISVCLLLVLLAIVVSAEPALSICAMPRPGIPEGGGGRGRDQPPGGSPDEPGVGSPGAEGPVPVSGGGGPGAAPPGGPPPGAGGPSSGPSGGGSRGRRRRGPSYAGSWYLWWELNRERLLGLRGNARGREAVTDDGDAVAPYRDRVREVLRKAAEAAEDDSVRAAALRALGRAGTDEDAARFLEILESRSGKPEVRRGAALGLALLPEIADEKARTRIREFLAVILDGGSSLSRRTRELATMGLGLRARTDPSLLSALLRAAGKPGADANEAAARFLSLGLTGDPMAGTVLGDVVRTGKHRKDKVHDVARAHAATGLALCKDPAAVDTYARVLLDSGVQVQTRRAATIGLGLVLREQDLPERTRKVAVRVLKRLLAGDRDPIVAGYAAIGLGFARPPAALDALMRAAGRSGGTVEAPYAALALGLAARRLPDAEGKRLRRTLSKMYAGCRDMELSGALAIACGIAGAKEARKHLVERVEKESTPLRVRAMAAQALGLLGDPTPEIEVLLRKVLDDGAPLISENAAIALGLLGRRETAKLLVEKLFDTRSKVLQTHMVIALTHLGGTGAIEPLAAALEQGRRKPRILVCAATVLGILVDDRQIDPLFEIDSVVNPFGLTAASRELVIAY